MNVKELRNVTLFNLAFVLRDAIMHHFGLFTVKAQIKQRIFFRRLVKEDAQWKLKINSAIHQMPDGFFSDNSATNDFVVSLTSYGKRVGDALPYALFSLLNQTVLPDKIAVFLDEKQWNDNNLPAILKKLKRIGISFYYCEDVRSFTKLIPALTLFSTNVIVTIDDDIYYNDHLIEWLQNAYHKSDKKTVLGQWGVAPEKIDGDYIHYNLWKDCKTNTDYSEVSLLGVGGCLYPPHIFDDEILKSEIFLKLCPTADDIWFWVMEKRQNIKTQLIEPAGYGYNRTVNRIEEYDWSQTGTLMHANVVEGKNDEQLLALLGYYQID